MSSALSSHIPIVHCHNDTSYYFILPHPNHSLLDCFSSVEKFCDVADRASLKSPSSTVNIKELSTFLSCYCLPVVSSKPFCELFILVAFFCKSSAKFLTPSEQGFQLDIF